MIEVIRIPAFKDNYIWLLRNGAAAVVVDPGDARPVLDVLEREGLSLTAILITHHHTDHQGGIASLLAQHPCEVFGPAAESITGLTQPLRGGETIRLESLDAEFRVLPVPRAYAWTPCVLWRRVSVLWRYAVWCRLWPSV